MTTNPPTDPSTADVDVTQRPRLVTRLRLVPLSILVALTLVAGVVGVFHDGIISSEQPAAAAAPASDRATAAEKAAKQAEKAAAKAKKDCTPAWKTGVKSETWVGAKKKASEKTYKAKIKKENPGYIKGKKGWLFFPDAFANNFSQAVGRITHTTAKQKAWANYFAKAQKLTAKQGGTFHVVVAPATWEVHPETLPSWAQALRGTNTLTKLMKAYPKLPWIDTRSALLKSAKAGKAVYEPLNSHWTPYGGYVAWQAISKCLATDKGLDKVGVPALDRISVEENLNEFAGNGVPNGKPVRTVPVYTAPLPATTMTKYPSGEPIAADPYGGLDAFFLPADTSTPGALSDQTLLVYRDSTGSGLSPLWTYSFAKTAQYHHGILTTQSKPVKLAKAIKAHSPDLFLYVISERNLDGMPPKA